MGSQAEHSSTKTKKRKRPVDEDMLENAMDIVITKMVKIQDKSDKKMCELEEK